MFLARLSVRRPVLTSVIIVVFLVLGVQSYQRLALEMTPDIDFPLISVRTIYPGAGPEEVESQITKRLEDQIATLSELKSLSSTSMDSLSYIMAEFEVGVDSDLKAIEVKDKVDAILFELPKDAEKPSVEKLSINAEPIIQLNLVGNRPATEMYFIADTMIRDRLAQVPGVGNVELTGGRAREIQVLVDKSLAQSYGLSLGMIASLIGMENLNIPGGRIIKDTQEYAIRMVGQFNDVSEIEEVKIPLSTGEVIRISDVADVADGFKDPRTDAFFATQSTHEDGSRGDVAPIRSAINMGIIKKTGANTVSTAQGVMELAEKLKQELPPDIKVSVSSDTSFYIKDMASGTIINIIIGIILTSMLMFIFLHSTRSTLIVSISMPAALIATFLLIDFAGFSINIITLMALGVAVGTLVTNTIVVLESITYNLEKGKMPAEAAIDGTSEVTVAVFASTLTNIVVFTPIAFMGGIVGQFMRQFGLTVIFATLFSLWMSFTLVPMMASMLMRPRAQGSGPHLHGFGLAFEKLFNVFKQDYKVLLNWGLRHRAIAILVSIILFVGGISLFAFVGSEFAPSGDVGLATVQVKMPVGASLKQTTEVMREIDEIVRRLTPETRDITIAIGGETKGVEEASLILDIGPMDERDRGVREIVDGIRPALAKIPAAELTVFLGIARGTMAADMEVNVVGRDLDEVKRVAKELIEFMHGVKGLADVTMDYRTGKPEIAFIPDREQISRYGLTSAQVAMEIRNAYEGNVPSTFRELGEEYDIRVLLTESERHDPDSLAALYMGTSVGPVPFDQLGDFVPSTAESKIRRMDRQQVINIYANITQGVLGDKQKEIQKKVDQMKLGSAKVSFGGFGEIMAEMFTEIISALILAIILTYLVLAGIQESIVHPITVMVTLPLGAVGAAFALFITGTSLSITSMMAIVMLVGIVVNNAILIFDYARQLRDEGMPIAEAVVEAATTRLRPIMMMNLAIAISMAPQIIPGPGSEFRQAMAIVTIGGVIISMVFTLLLLPVLYILFDKLTSRGRKESRENALADSAMPAK